MTTPDDRVSYMNPAAQRLIAAGQDVTDRPLASLFSISEQPVQGSFRTAEADGESHPQQRLLLRPDQSSVPVSVVETPITHVGHWAGRVMIIHDMTAERRLVEELAWAASHDALTGLANRRQFEFELHKSMSGSSEASADLMLIDLDQFKIINDTCGHMAGDRLLKQVAKLLAGEVGSSGLVARLGGDEFGILLREGNASGRETATDIAERIRAVVEQSNFVYESSGFRTDGKMISLAKAAARFGICVGSAKNLVLKGILPATQAIKGSQWLVPVDALSSEAVRVAVQHVIERRPKNYIDYQYDRVIRLPGI
ncbi:GGDEF domain-containing protein [Bradyrhizobium sp. JR3.5]